MASKSTQRASTGVFLQKAAKTHFTWRRLQAQDGIADHFAHHGTVLKAMTGAAARDPDIFRFRVAVQNEVMVGGVFVLTDPAFQQRRAGHSWKAETKIGACSRQPLIRNPAFHGGGINDRSARVVSHLEAASLVSWNAIEQVFSSHGLSTAINPDRKLRVGEAQVAGGGAEEKDFLAGGRDNLRQRGEDFS